MDLTKNCFNTSHVTVYHFWFKTVFADCFVSIHLMLRFISYWVVKQGKVYGFQYISCYGLSEQQAGNGFNEKLFQYISCYGLSRIQQKFTGSYTRFNTSHVTVYQSPALPVPGKFLFQYISCYGLSISRTSLNLFKGVSIHLMLRFIMVLIAFLCGVLPFQYISCYGLS